MRAIAQHGEYGIQIRPQRQQGLGDGSIKVTQEPIYAKFDRDGAIFEAEIEKAEKVFAFSGRFQHRDEATPVAVDYRLSLFDTDLQGYDPETKALVEEELRRKEPITRDFFISEERPLDPPYPAWDESEKPAFEMVAGLVEMGYDLQAALDYERAFGPSRERVVEALEETIRDREQDTITA
jgi:hypothetical protein